MHCVLQTVFKHMDSGILKYTDVDEMVRVVLGADYSLSSMRMTASPTIDTTADSSSSTP